MIRRIDSLLNKITMYRLTLYYLIALLGIAVIAATFGFISYNPVDILLNTVIALVACMIGNYIFAKLFHAATNVESVFITALILTVIIPVKFPLHVSFILLASFFAMASKYLLTVEKQHIFNPAAVAVAGIALLSPEHSAVWWIGTPFLVPFVLIGGYLVMRKIRREQMISMFFLVYYLAAAIASIVHTGNIFGIIDTWKQASLHSALFFFAFVMLTEPITSPGRKEQQGYYAAIVGLLYATPQLRLLGFVLTPELALCVGNVYSHFVSPKYRFLLSVSEKIQATKDTMLFLFPKMKDFTYIPGQYMEWTLPHSPVDNRGNRRYFSLASSPTEGNLMLVVKFYDPPSSFKKHLQPIQKNDRIIASQLAGDFTLPRNIRKPLVFFAGGVGIAPFRSMIQYLMDKNIQANITLLFANRTPDDIIFTDTFKSAEKLGIKTVYILTEPSSAPNNWQGETGRITPEMIERTVPNYQKSMFYISGPQLMVQSYETLLLQMGIKHRNVIVDFFPGYEEK